MNLHPLCRQVLFCIYPCPLVSKNCICTRDTSILLAYRKFSRSIYCSRYSLVVLDKLQRRLVTRAQPWSSLASADFGRCNIPWAPNIAVTGLVSAEPLRGSTRRTHFLYFCAHTNNIGAMNVMKISTAEHSAMTVRDSCSSKYSARELRAAVVINHKGVEISYIKVSYPSSHYHELPAHLNSGFQYGV